MTERLTAGELDRLLDAVCGLNAGSGAGPRAVARAMYALLDEGRPVTAPRLAEALGVDVARAAASLDALPNLERDAEGAVAGFGGLTLRRTPHRLSFAGRERFAWCAWDTLFLPVALGAVADVSASCGHTARPVRLRVAPTGILERHPDTLVVSFVEPAGVDTTDLRASFCGAVQFVADAAAAARWAAANDGRLVLGLDDAFELGRRMLADRCGI